MGVLFAYLISNRCGVLFICCRVTPNTYFQINEQLHTFFFLQTIIAELI